MVEISKYHYVGIFIFKCAFISCTMASNISVMENVFLNALGTQTLTTLVTIPKSSKFNYNKMCLLGNATYSQLLHCVNSQCIGVSDVAGFYGVGVDSPLDQRAMLELAPAVLYINTQHRCSGNVLNNDTMPTSSSQLAMWGYSFLFVTLINMCSLTGIVMLPCMKSDFYKVMLMFMVALAVGTLVGNGVLVLIPEAFDLVHIGQSGGEDESSLKHVWISTSIIGGIYLFFLIERVMRIISRLRENTKEKIEEDELAVQGTMTSSFALHAPVSANQKMKSTDNIHLAQTASGSCLCDVTVSMFGEPVRHTEIVGGGDGGGECQSGNSLPSEICRGCCCKADDVSAHQKSAVHHLAVDNGHWHNSYHAGLQDGHRVAPVAYMVVFGDGLHNFIDGLSIGAAFTDSILLGISVSVAVLCEELPHELGDFAILLNSGMRLRKALVYNFLSSLMCYFGLVVGIVVGGHTTYHKWIFGLAGGMFLYISLVDMMPEMNAASELSNVTVSGMLKMFFIQNCGLLIGYSIILMLAVYGGEISFD